MTVRGRDERSEDAYGSGALSLAERLEIERVTVEIQRRNAVANPRVRAIRQRRLDQLAAIGWRDVDEPIGVGDATWSRNSRRLASVKAVVFAPRQMASESAAVSVKRGLRASSRAP